MVKLMVPDLEISNLYLVKNKCGLQFLEAVANFVWVIVSMKQTLLINYIVLTMDQLLVFIKYVGKNKC